MPLRFFRPLALVPIALLVAGCTTPCQRLCVQLADYARECGIEVSDAEVDACMDEQRDEPNQGACRRTGGADTIRSEWTCDDLEVFFQ